MKIDVAIDEPPLIEEIDAVFHIRGKPVIFAWGRTIFNPCDVEIPFQLLAHEHVHCERQGTDEAAIEIWWRRYMADSAFRLQEELHAHYAEYRALAGHGTRQVRRSALKVVSKRLAAPLYGRMVSASQARSLLVGLDKQRANA